MRRNDNYQDFRFSTASSIFFSPSVIVADFVIPHGKWASLLPQLRRTLFLFPSFDSSLSRILQGNSFHLTGICSLLALVSRPSSHQRFDGYWIDTLPRYRLHDVVSMQTIPLPVLIAHSSASMEFSWYDLLRIHATYRTRAATRRYLHEVVSEIVRVYGPAMKVTRRNDQNFFRFILLRFPSGVLCNVSFFFQRFNLLSN